jgi:hypothetical protein
MKKKNASSYDRMIMNDVSGEMWKEVVIYFKRLLRN